MFYRRFIFGKVPSETGAEGRAGSGDCAETGTEDAATVRVRAGDFYEPGRGYGFVTEKNRREQERLRVPELNSAFDAACWYQNQELTLVEEDRFGCFLDSDGEIARLEKGAGAPFEGEHRRIPLSFKLDVPCQGNYKVIVEIRSEQPMRDVLIFTGRRHLGYRGDVPGEGSSNGFGPEGGLHAQGTEYGQEDGADIGKGFSCTMMANVCDIVPRGHRSVYEDRTLDITVVADRPVITSVVVEEAECPTVFIAGDSTVTDQSADYPYAPGSSYSGWGQMISAYLEGNIAVSNHAHSGLTTQSFREEGHYGIVERYIRPGDYYFCQFGHNDQKLESLKAEEGYRRNLIRYIRECRERRAFPVLVTPLARNTWKGSDGSYNDLLEEYAAVCVSIGHQEDVPVLDLHKRSMDFIREMGLEASKACFFPGDYTHSNDYGGYFMAGLVAQEIREVCGRRKEAKYRFLADCVTDGFGAWRPGERIVPLTRPADCGETPEAKEMPILSDGRDLSEPLDRVSALELVIRTAGFFPTNVYNDMFTDVVGHEWYAGTVECAYQNGIIDMGLVEDGRFRPLQPVTLEEFLVFAVNGYRSRKAIPENGSIGKTCDGKSCRIQTDISEPRTEKEMWERGCAYDGRCREAALPYIQAACRLGLIPCDGGAELGQGITRGAAVELCRKLGI